MYWKCVSALLEWEFHVHMAVCDGGQSNRNFILMHFENEQDAIGKKFTIFSELTGSLHAFMMDPSVSLTMKTMLYESLYSNINKITRLHYR